MVDYNVHCIDLLRPTERTSTLQSESSIYQGLLLYNRKHIFIFGWSSLQYWSYNIDQVLCYYNEIRIFLHSLSLSIQLIRTNFHRSRNVSIIISEPRLQNLIRNNNLNDLYQTIYVCYDLAISWMLLCVLCLVINNRPV